MVSFVKSVAVIAFAALAAAVPSPLTDPYTVKRGTKHSDVQEQVCGPHNQVVSCCNNESTKVDASENFIDSLADGSDLISGAQCWTTAINPGAGVLGGGVPIQNQQDQKCSSTVACCQKEEGNEVNGFVAINAEANCNIVKGL